GFDAAELGLAGLFAARAGAAVAAARHCFEQSSITNVLIRELLPPAMTSVDGVELAARYLPAADGQRVGGDFYDLFPAGGETLLVLGDVCGKGLRAAILAGKIRAVLKAIGPSTGDHLEVLCRLNDLLLPEDDPFGFVTLVLASAVSLGDGLLRLRVTGAGHPQPLVVRRDGRVDRVPTSGTLIGVLPEITAETVIVDLAPGDVCLLHTDGVVEARGGPSGSEFLGDDRLISELAGCAGLPPEAMAERVQRLAFGWIGDGGHDDMAFVTIAPGPAC
ncbi:PP2C family protein-serine/threonine phosphatase, partial [Actinocorallia lasiicapitis]